MSTRVPESKLKAAATKKAVEKAPQARGCTKAHALKRGLELAQKERIEKQTAAALRTKAASEGRYFVESTPKIAFVVRTKGIHKVPPKPRKILCLFRLRQIYNGVFVKLNASTIPMLRAIEPWVTYGQVSTPTVKKLLFKRGFVKINNQRIPITDNDNIGKVLGEKGVECVEDLIHEVYTCGPNFKDVNNFLWPFKLSSPKGGYRKKKRRHFNEGGTYGNCETFINGFVRKMN